MQRYFLLFALLAFTSPLIAQSDSIKPYIKLRGSDEFLYFDQVNFKGLKVECIKGGETTTYKNKEVETATYKFQFEKDVKKKNEGMQPIMYNQVKYLHITQKYVSRENFVTTLETKSDFNINGKFTCVMYATGDTMIVLYADNALHELERSMDSKLSSSYYLVIGNDATVLKLSNMLPKQYINSMDYAISVFEKYPEVVELLAKIKNHEAEFNDLRFLYYNTEAYIEL